MKNCFLKGALCFFISLCFLSNAKAQQPSATVSVQNVSCGPVKGIAVVTPSGGTGYTYKWSAGGSSTNIDTGLAAGSYTVTVYSTPATDSVVVPFTIGTATPITGTVTVHPDHCGLDTGSAVVNVTGGDTPYVYMWSMGTGLGDSAMQLTGDSTVYVTVTDSHGCMDTLSAYVNSISGPTATINTPDTLCVSDNTGILIVSPSGFGSFMYQWSNGPTANVDAGLTPGPYSVTVWDGAGCDTVLHTDIPSYSVQNNIAIIPDGTVRLGQTVEIEIVTNVPVNAVTWDPYIAGSTNNLVVAFVPSQSAQYTVTARYGQTCQFIDTVQIVVLGDTGNFVIPNTFTPNGDGLNDQFTLLTIPDVSSFHIWIYDRWGNKVFESTDVNFAWDGTDQYAGGKPLEVGVYAYVVQYQAIGADQKRTVGGNISLVK